MADVESRKNMTESTGYEGSEGLKARCGKVHRGMTLCFFSMLRVQTLSWWGQAKVLASQRSWQSHLAPSTRTMKRIETGILEKWLVWCYLKVNNVFWPGLPSSSACRRLGSPRCSNAETVWKWLKMYEHVEPCRAMSNPNKFQNAMCIFTPAPNVFTQTELLTSTTFRGCSSNLSPHAVKAGHWMVLGKGQAKCTSFAFKLGKVWV